MLPYSAKSESAVDITINLLVNFSFRGGFVEMGTEGNLYFSGRVHTWHSQQRTYTWIRKTQTALRRFATFIFLPIIFLSYFHLSRAP